MTHSDVVIAVNELFEAVIENQHRAEDAEQRVDDLEAKIDELRWQNEAAEGTIDDLRCQNAGLRDSFDSIQEILDTQADDDEPFLRNNEQPR